MHRLDLDKDSPRQPIIRFLLWYRLVTVGLVAFFAFSGIKSVPLLPLLFVLIFNIIVQLFSARIGGLVQKYPLLLVFDLLLSFALLVGSGGYSSPYYLYSLSPLIVGAYIFRYKGALILASAQSLLFFEAVHIGGYRLIDIFKTGESIVTDFFVFFITCFSVAYLADLLLKYDTASSEVESVDSKLQLKRNQLDLCIMLSNLSEREGQVLRLAAEGKTALQIASSIGVSADTVKTYFRRIYKKMGVSTKQEAILKVFDYENSLD